MRKEVVVSLGDDLKGLGEVLGSSSCVKILELLAEEDLTVSEISERLSMKLNTVDYNVKKLVRAGLIERSGHWWSVKGKKMDKYRVIDRKIVISPRRKVVGKFLWVLGLTGALGIWLRSLSVEKVSQNVLLATEDGALMTKGAVFDVAPSVADFVIEEAQMMAANGGIAESVVRSVGDVGFWGSLAGWEWFLFGAWSAVVLFFVFSLVSESRFGKSSRNIFRFKILKGGKLNNEN